MGPSDQLESYLEEVQAPHLVRHHSRSMTALQLAEAENINPHEVAKVVILKDSEHYYMMVLPADYQLDLRAVRETIGNPEITLAPESELATLFPDCEVGAMPPFGMLYQMPVYAETSLSDDKEIEFHAGSHQDAIRMKYSHWHAMVKPQMGHFGHKMH